MTHYTQDQLYSLFRDRGMCGRLLDADRVCILPAGHPEHPIEDAPPRREVIPLSAHATGAKVRISASPVRSVQPKSVAVKEPDGTAWRVVSMIIDDVPVDGAPWPPCPGHRWIDLDVECPHGHPPTEAAPVELHGVIVCEASDLPVSTVVSERDRQWKEAMRKPYGARKRADGEWETTFRGDFTNEHSSHDVPLPREETIVAAAVRIDGVICSVPPPGRHHNVVHWLTAIGLESTLQAQGFLTSTGRFVDRMEARRIAQAAGQLDRVRPKTHPKEELFSEDLW